MKKSRIFISSVQGEFRGERVALRDYVKTHPVLDSVFEVFLFEDLVASSRSPSDVFLGEVDSSEIFVGLYGREYGKADASGLSPTEKEFRRARERGVHCLFFLKREEGGDRHPKMQALVDEMQAGHVRKAFENTEGLLEEFAKALGEYIRAKHAALASFDSAPCEHAALDDIDQEKIGWFLSLAQEKSGFSLPGDPSPRNVLTHLGMVSDGRPTNAGMLMFGKRPQKFLLASGVKCMQFPGHEHIKPMRSYKIIDGTVLDLVRQSVAFVLDKIDMAVGTRENSLRAPRTFEIPPEVVTEAIVNAISHRDYTLAGSVQVMLYSDRLEVTNPGGLPPGLTIEQLNVSRRSHPRNPSLTKALLRTKLSEEAGTGIQNMARHCADADLPVPEFSASGCFGIKIWRARPRIVDVRVLADGRAASGIDVLAVSNGGVATRSTTNSDGIAHLEISSPRNPTSVFAAGADLSAAVARGWIPATDSLLLSMSRAPGVGSLIFTDNGGFLPGFSGRISCFRDSSGGHYLEAPGLAVNGEESRPVAFAIGETLKVRDHQGGIAEFRFIEMAGSFSLLELRSIQAASVPQAPDLALRLLRKVSRGPLPRKELAHALGVGTRTKLFQGTVAALIGENLIEHTIPGAPTSRMQKYRITKKGMGRLAERAPRSGD